MPWLSIRRRNIAIWAIVFLAFIQLAACGQRTFYPVTVEELEVSPAYRLEIVNQTSQPLKFLPIRKYRADYPSRRVPTGQHISCLVQVSRIKVGHTFSREIVAGPFIDSGRLGPDLAHIQFMDSQEIKHDIVIDISHSSWFAPYSVSGNAGQWQPRSITIRLTDETLARDKWFASGPGEP